VAVRGALQQARRRITTLEQQLAGEKKQFLKAQGQLAKVTEDLRCEPQTRAPASPLWVLYKTNVSKEGKHAPGQKRDHPAHIVPCAV